jgi:signal transduction histidine kinase
VMEQIRAGQGVRHFETVRRRKDGKLLDISLTVSPIRAHSRAIIGSSKSARDITQEKALRRAAAEISRGKDEFLATLSHELRTPLNALLGYTQMMQTGALDPESLAKALDAMARNGQALVGLLNDVLDASRIVTGLVRLQLGPIDLGTVLGEAIETIRPTTMAKGLQLEVSVERDLMVNGDPDRLRQAFWNLLSNPVKFTPSGSVEVRGWREGRHVRVDFEDTGLGISPGALPRVFERFWQADSTHTRDQGGLGLGLSLVRYFVELHGGHITAHSQGPGRGARFEITLPIRPAQ